MALPTEIDANRLERDELEMLQARALRSWQQSDWLAKNNPMAWDKLNDFPDEVWLDIGGGAGESQQEPGAIVVGSGGMSLDSRTGERRHPDMDYNIASGVPAADASVDKVIVPENTLRPKNPADQDYLLTEIARALRVGGSLIIREESSLLQALRPALDRLGFQLDSTSRRVDRDHEQRFVLTQNATRPGGPIGRETVMGETRPPAIRQPV